MQGQSGDFCLTAYSLEVVVTKRRRKLGYVGIVLCFQMRESNGPFN